VVPARSVRLRPVAPVDGALKQPFTTRLLQLARPVSGTLHAVACPEFVGRGRQHHKSGDVLPIANLLGAGYSATDDNCLGGSALRNASSPISTGRRSCIDASKIAMFGVAADAA
jgi:hypothetical protein